MNHLLQFPIFLVEKPHGVEPKGLAIQVRNLLDLHYEGVYVGIESKWDLRCCRKFIAKYIDASR